MLYPLKQKLRLKAHSHLKEVNLVIIINLETTMSKCFTKKVDQPRQHTIFVHTLTLPDIHHGIMTGAASPHSCPRPIHLTIIHMSLRFCPVAEVKLRVEQCVHQSSWHVDLPRTVL